MEFTRKEVENLLGFFGEKDPDDPDMTITVIHSDELNHPGKGFPNYGLHAYYTEYPEEGCLFLGEDKPCEKKGGDDGEGG